MGEIICTTTDRGEKALFMMDFLIDWTEHVIKF